MLEMVGRHLGADIGATDFECSRCACRGSRIAATLLTESVDSKVLRYDGMLSSISAAVRSQWRSPNCGQMDMGCDCRDRSWSAGGQPFTLS